MKSFSESLFLLALLAANAGAQIWQPVQDVHPNALSMGINPKNQRTVWFGTQSNGIYVSYDGGKRASRIVRVPLAIASPFFTSVLIHPVDTSFVIIAGSGCFKSNDAGLTWSHALPETTLSFNGESITYEPNQPDTLYAVAVRNRQNPGRFFFRSFDRGQSWQPLTIPSQGRNGFCSIVAGGNGLLLAGTYSGGQIWRSADHGATWRLVYASADTIAEVPKITFDRTDANSIWATIWKVVNISNTHIVKSADRGLTWQNYAVPGNPWAIETDAQGRVFVGMLDIGAAGAFMSNDGGESWTRLSQGLPASEPTGSVFMLKSDGGSPGLYMADFNMGAYKLESLPVAVSSRPQLLPHHFRLLQNYPNPYGRQPFNPTTQIRYSLPAPQFVTLKIFDALGREVVILVNKFQAAGDYAVDFDASQLANSGVYFYQINVGTFQQTRKMICLK
jgi:photosystem II stability/assembly factor-like uncharacterized protein